MLTEKRHEYILQQLKANGIVTINDLLVPLEASESTIRRDLQHLEDQGLLIRVHGGAKRIHRLKHEAKITERTGQFHSEKVTIARFAAELIKAEEVIYLDAGSTTFEMIPFIPTHLQIKVVTNSVKHAAALTEREIDTHILGGSVKIVTNAVLGSQATQQLQLYHFDRAFLGMNGMDTQAGFTTPDPEEAFLKTTAMKQSDVTYVLADHSKFQQVTFTKVADLEVATILTDFCPNGQYQKFTKYTKIQEVNK